ncbi:hypothetical protein EG329_013023 [Mollisiaceae sp. DMI_Dod_QoI]|nr:hypothetical protein EG329_013023 [Helotiales sp. DMI_Dod_QoI]
MRQEKEGEMPVKLGGCTQYPEERDPSSGIQVGERLGRIEQVLEKLVAKIEQYEEEENSAQKIMTPDSSNNNDVLTPYATDGNSNAQADNAPFMQLFDNPLLGRGTATQSQTTTPATQSTGVKTPSCRTPKLERIRQALIELLPTQRETNMICDASSSWLLTHAMAVQKNDSVTSSTFDLARVSKEHPTRIARTVLYIAVCLQQLDQGFDTSQLRLYPTVEARMDKCINVVQALITSDDELTSTVVGLECLILQGVFHINAGNPRRAWLNFRRAISIGQLMGIHKRECTIPGGREIWFQVVQVDRYLALLLGLPAGSEDVTFGPDETFENPDMNKDKLFARKLCNISGRIIDRNKSESSHAYATTQEIDESLERLAKGMPPGWWDIPDVIPNDRSDEAADKFDRVMVQIWFFQVEAIAHLPFMLRASTERRYDYSKFSCLKASREMMARYLALRKAENKSFCCKVVDFGALTSCVTLFLGLLDPVTGTESLQERQQRETDKALVHTVLRSMEDLSNGGKDVVATQSVNVIKSLLAVDDSSGNTSNLKLTIPYFGTISIMRPRAPRTPGCTTNFSYVQQEPLGQQLASHSWENYPLPPQTPTQNPVNQPLVSFQSSQFPPLLPDQQSIHDWALPEADTLFFDSLLNTDIEGNWIF